MNKKNNPKEHTHTHTEFKQEITFTNISSSDKTQHMKWSNKDNVLESGFIYTQRTRCE